MLLSFEVERVSCSIEPGEKSRLSCASNEVVERVSSPARF